jgi:hypothetical protein
MNQIYSSWYYDYQNLERFMIYGGPDAPPLSPATIQGGFIYDWNVTQWDDAGTNKTLYMQWWKDNGYYAKPDTGAQGSNVNTTDFFFSIWYYYADPTAWQYSTTQDIHHVDVYSDTYVEIFFDSISYWFVYQASPFILPVDTWLRTPLCEAHTETFTVDTDLTTPGAVGLSDSPVWINSITVDGTTELDMRTEWNIIKGELHILVSLSSGASVEVDYWGYGDPSGYTAGNLPWETIFEGAGQFWCDGFTPGTGGSGTYRRNPYSASTFQCSALYHTGPTTSEKRTLC